MKMSRLFEENSRLRYNLRNMKRFLSLVLVAAILVLPAVAHAEDSLSITGKRVKVVAKSAGFGLVGGLVVGLASQVFKKKTQNIFMFGSLGLYAGILLGIYVVTSAPGPTKYEGPDTYEDFSLAKGIPGTLAYNKQQSSVSPTELKVNFLSVEF